MSNISETLPVVRYFTKDDPYHYTTENRPLEDLAARDNMLAVAVDALSALSSDLEVLTWMNI